MAKNFSFRSLFVPSTPRSKVLRGMAGTVVVNNQSAGVPNTPATTVVNNYNITNNYTQEGGGVQVIRITIADLLALTPEQIQVSDIYAVHSSGSDESGWSKDGEFELNGKMYPDGSYAQYVDGVWLIADKDVVKTENEAIFNPLQKIVSLISKTYSQSSYDNLPGRVKAGIPIAEVRNYELDEAGVYQEKKESQTGSQSAETNVKTLVVPYARSYAQGGEMVYEGGVLTASDYEKLCKGGNGNVDDVQVNGASVVDNNIANIALSTYLNNYATQSWVEGKGYLTSASLNGYATQSWVQSNFALKTDVPTKLSDIQNDSNLYVSNIYITDISAQGSWVKYAFTVSGVDTHGVPLKAGDYLLNGTQLWRVDLIGGNTGYCINAGVQIMPTIDTSAPETPADDHVPSTKLFADNMKIIGELFNGLADRKADKSDLNNYYNKTEMDENYYNKAYLNVWIKSVPTKSETQFRSDYVRFEQTGQYASYTFSTTASRGATLSNRTSSTSGTNNLHICVHITGLTTTAEYNVYLQTHRVSLVFCGKDTSGNVIQMEVLRNVSVNQIGTDVFFILQLESGKVFDPSSYPNTFNVVFTPID